jgi:DNA polymerase-3 subunit delta
MVAIKAHEADRILAAPPDAIRLFLIHGSDAGAVTERARAVERVALQRGGGDVVTRIGSDTLSADPGRVADEAYSVSMFGGEPVIAVRVLDGRHNVIGALEPLLARPPDNAWVVVEAGELTPANPLRKAFEGSKHALAVPTYTLESADIAALVAEWAERSGLIVATAARDLLLEHLGGDRLAIHGELEKLLLYLGDEKTVGAEAVEAIVGDTTAAKTDQVIDAALRGDNEGLETALGRMRSEGGSPSALGALALRHLLQLQTLRASVDSGERPARAIDFARPPIFGRRKPVVEAALKDWPSDALVEARHRIDRAIMLMRTQPALEEAAISEALHAIALKARRLKRRR